MAQATILGIETSWAERQTYWTLLVHVIAVGETMGGTWDYSRMWWAEKQPQPGNKGRR